jgi:thiol-disulfide isomerase/thioredoxin
MIRKVLLSIAAAGVTLIGAAAVLYVTNGPPAVSPIPSHEAAASDKPYVVKLHAQWCPVCLVTKDVWSDIEEAYAGRVNLVVLDFTSEATTRASEVEARRLHLEAVVDELSGATGMVVVVDGRTREMTAAIGGSRDFAAYREAIDAALIRQ